MCAFSNHSLFLLIDFIYTAISLRYALLFVIYNNKSANKVITYADSNNYKTGIDNMNAESNRKRIWVPYPLLCDQVGNDTNIGTNAEYLEKINKAFKEVHKRLDDFVAKSV